MKKSHCLEHDEISLVCESCSLYSFNPLLWRKKLSIVLKGWKQTVLAIFQGTTSREDNSLSTWKMLHWTHYKERAQRLFT